MLHGVGGKEGAMDQRGSECSIPQEYVEQFCIKFVHYLTSGLDCAVTEAEGHEEIFRVVLELPDNIPDKLDFLDFCGAYFLRSFLSKKNQKEDIDNCILAYKSAVHLTPHDHLDMSCRINMLGEAYYHCFKYAGGLANISNAISYQQEVVNLTPEGHADMPSWLNSLGLSLQSRFNHTGNLADISDAISYQQKAVNLTSEGHVDMPNWLNNLGNSFQSCFKHAGDLTDISDAISHQEAVNLTPEGHADMPSRLNSLGVSFRSHFEHTGDLGDISNAISYQKKAVNLTPEGHADMPRQLNNLGVSFQSRFNHIGDLADTDAISYKQRAVNLTPEGHADMPTWLNNLGNSFQSQFRSAGDLADISKAISYQQKAVNLTPKGHSNMPGQLNNLGNSFQSRFNCTGDLADISDAISYQQKAVNLTPEGHADMPSWLYNLGSSFQSRFKCTEDMADKYMHLSLDCQCATYSSGPPSKRLMAAMRWAQHSSYDPLQSLKAYGTAIKLVSEVAGLEQTIQKRHTKLLDISDLVTSGVACALKFGKPGLALEWLEQGRCLIWSQLNNLRTPLDALFAHDPEIACDMLRVSRALENAGSRGDLVAPSQGKAIMEHKMLLQDEANTHVKLAQEWNELLTKIRTIPKFKDFLQPPTCSNLLKNLPDSGSVIVINVHKDSCDALALSSDLDEPLHIPLHKFTFEKATNLHNQLNSYLHTANLQMRGTQLVGLNDSGSVIKHILHQLWTLVVKPILDGLGISVSTGITAILKSCSFFIFLKGTSI